MASIVGKRIKGQTYYYLRFDALAAAWLVLAELDVIGIIDRIVGTRRADAACTVGTYLALATANRVVAPCSKLAFADWWQTTAADRFTKVPTAALDHRRFWDAMDQLTPAQAAQIERAVVERMAERFGLDLQGLVVDMTNFATFIDSSNDGGVSGVLGGQPVELREVLELVPHSHLLIEPSLFGHVPDPPADLVVHRPASPQDLAGVGLQHAEDDPHGGGLAGAVGADEAEHLPLGDGEGEVVEGDQVAVAAGQSVELQHVVPPVLARMSGFRLHDSSGAGRCRPAGRGTSTGRPAPLDEVEESRRSGIGEAASVLRLKFVG